MFLLFLFVFLGQVLLLAGVGAVGFVLFMLLRRLWRLFRRLDGPFFWLTTSILSVKAGTGIHFGLFPGALGECNFPAFGRFPKLL